MPRTRIATTTQLTDLVTLAESFRRSLRARNRSPRTVRGYLEAASRFHAYLRRMGMPTIAAHLDREHVESFIADQLDRHKPNTAATRYRALQQLFRWLVEEGEIAVSPMVQMRPPAVPDAPPPILAVDEIKRLLATCEGRDFASRRDAAIIRLFADSGVRLAELTRLRLEDLDLDSGAVLVLAQGWPPEDCALRPADRIQRGPLPAAPFRAPPREPPRAVARPQRAAQPERRPSSGPAPGQGRRYPRPAPAQLPALLRALVPRWRRPRERPLHASRGGAHGKCSLDTRPPVQMSVPDSRTSGSL